MLFGPLIEKHFYVVVLSIRNQDDVDKLINTGMINAYGSALVVPQDNGDPYQFSIPIEISPLSSEQVYTAVVDEKPDGKREITFRALEFVGALATSLAVGFNATTDLTKAIGVYTGVGLPEGAKLWPDRVPGYLKNVVTFSMPEFVKVPRKGSIANKMLFFPRDKLRLIITDAQALWLENDQVESPPQCVAHLSFDTLEVPYEIVRSPTEITPPAQEER